MVSQRPRHSDLISLSLFIDCTFSDTFESHSWNVPLASAFKNKSNRLGDKFRACIGRDGVRDFRLTFFSCRYSFDIREDDGFIGSYFLRFYRCALN